jgi:hypothetical protein
MDPTYDGKLLQIIERDSWKTMTLEQTNSVACPEVATAKDRLKKAKREVQSSRFEVAKACPKRTTPSLTTFGRFFQRISNWIDNDCKVAQENLVNTHQKSASAEAELIRARRQCVKLEKK